MSLDGSTNVRDSDLRPEGIGTMGLRLLADAYGRAALAMVLGADPAVIVDLSEAVWRIRSSRPFRRAMGLRLPSWGRIERGLDREYSGCDEYTGQTDREALALNLDFIATEELYEQGGRERVWATVRHLMGKDRSEDPLLQILFLGACALRWAHDQNFRELWADIGIELGGLDEEILKMRAMERLVSSELGSNRVNKRDSSRSTVPIDNTRGISDGTPDIDDRLAAEEEMSGVLDSLPPSESRAIRFELEATRGGMKFSEYLRTQSLSEKEIRSMQRSKQRGHQRTRRKRNTQ